MDKKERLAPYLARIEALEKEEISLQERREHGDLSSRHAKTVEECVRIDKHFEKLMGDIGRQIDAVKHEIEDAGLWEEYCHYEYGREEDYEE